MHAVSLPTPSQSVSQIILLILLGCMSPAQSATTLPADPIELYQRDLRPLLERRCFSCHSRLEQKAGLRLDAGVLIHKGAKSGSILRPDADGTVNLIDRLTSKDPDHRMPPEGAALAADEIAVVTRWLDAGAPYPKDEPIPVAPGDHWAFQPVLRPPIPPVRHPDWPRTPIDAFLLAKLETRNWTPAPTAQALTLLRRVHLDLTGIPPTPAEQEQFLHAPAATALDETIDRLLTRPTYGERWARHWLDLVRYADSNGYERDAEKPAVWRYRDYVIRAFNQDKPYDQFVLEQLAGDELPNPTAETLIATGFHRLGHWDDEPADPDTDRYDQIDDIVSTTSQAFLGLTVGCARCHDHKFEPISTRDYYSLVSVFNPLVRPRNGRTELTLPAGTPDQLLAQADRDRQIVHWQKQSNTLAPEIIAREVQRLRATRPDLPQAYFFHEPSPKPPETRVLLRGNPARPGPAVEPAIPVILARLPAVFPPADDRTSRRRLGLAQWIVHPDNPLTARVLVNRIWQHHFGEGLVRTPNDFGVMGEPPTHPELLDWLAHWFVHDARWSIKALHRLILRSQAWRMSRTRRPDYASTDPDNRLLWRMPYRRLEVEAIRDSILAVSGRLNLEQEGRGVFLPIPKAALEANTDKESIWTGSSEAEASRRSIYAFVKRGLVVPFFEVLDLCDTVHTSPQRQTTTVAPQALTLFNGDFVQNEARHCANRLLREAGPDPARQVQLAYRLALARSPSSMELKTALDFLSTRTPIADRPSAPPHSPHPSLHPVTPPESLVQFCRVLFNLNEFAYAD